MFTCHTATHLVELLRLADAIALESEGVLLHRLAVYFVVVVETRAVDNRAYLLAVDA
jgi:hypothetical protein